MNRRNFLGLAPIGLAGIAAMAKGNEPETKVMKTDVFTIQGPDGKHYSPLLVETTDTDYKSISRAPVERARLSSDGNFMVNAGLVPAMSLDANGRLGL